MNRINVVNASCKSPTRYTPESIFDFVSDGNSGFFAASGNNDEWFQYDFFENGVKVTDYVIQNLPGDFLPQWEIHCSLDNVKWEIIDRKTMSSKPQGGNTKIVIVFQPDHLKICRYFRVQQKAPRFVGDNLFPLHKLELFGMFYDHYSLMRALDETNKCIICFIFQFYLSSFTIFLYSSK